MQSSVLIVAGEASADRHAAAVATALKAGRPDLQMFGVGGERLRAAGVEIVADACSISVAGITEVAGALPRLYRLFRRLEALARQRLPRAALLVDLPDFNLPLAARLKALGVPVVYYVSPQLWAWRPGRVRAIRRRVDKMLVILPFEESFYRARGVAAEYVGHPLVEGTCRRLSAHAARAQLALPARQPTVALLPGSRHSEVRRHLPIMLRALERLVARLGPVSAGLPVATGDLAEAVRAHVRAAAVPVRILAGGADAALSAADVAVVCSGTATLEAALLGRPMVVVYRVSWLTYWLLRPLVRVRHIALANLVAGERVAPELVQSQLTPERLADCVEELLCNPARQVDMRRRLLALRERLGDLRSAARVAWHVSRLAPAPEDREVVRGA